MVINIKRERPTFREYSFGGGALLDFHEGELFNVADKPV